MRPEDLRRRGTPKCGAIRAIADMHSPDHHRAAGSAVVLPGPLIQDDLPALERANTEQFCRPDRQRSRHQRQRSSSEGRKEMITPEEYATLPASIQKKYFSPQQRLRIAQQAAAHTRKEQCRKQTWLSATSTVDHDPRPHSVQEVNRRWDSTSSASSAEINTLDRPVTRDQAVWYLALPEKVRRQQFSKEEQIVLTDECERVVQGTAHDRDVGTRSQSAPENSSQAIAYATPESEAGVLARKDSHDTDTFSCSTCDTEDTKMGIFKLYSRKTVPAVTPVVEVPPLPSHPPPSPPTIQQAARLKRRSFHRAVTLTPIALPPPTLAPLHASPSPATPQTVIFKSRLSRPYIDFGMLPSWPLPERLQAPPATEIYELPCDPETHQAISEIVRMDGPLATDSLAPTSASSDGSFPIQRTSSDYGNEADDASLQTDGPSTPVATSSHDYRTVAQSASFDSGVVLPMQLNATEKCERSRSASTASHQSAYTRAASATPDLRVPEDRLYSWQRTQASGVLVADSDPLALAPLSVNDDLTGAHGAFATNHCAHGKTLGRMFKSFRRH